MKPWYEITNRINQAIDVELHDEIGLGGITAADFIKELQSHRNARSINLSIHSPGGNMLDGLAMFNALKAHPAKVYAHVTGIAASAASTVLMAGDVVTMPEDAYIMIHNPMGGVYGGSEEMRDYADIMDKLKAGAVNIYVNKTGKSVNEISEMMDSETWLNSTEALNYGFTDKITNAVGVANKLNTFNKYFKSMPFNTSNSAKVAEIENQFQLNNFLVESGFTYDIANALTNKLRNIAQNQPKERLIDKSMQTVARALAKIKIPKSING